MSLIDDRWREAPTGRRASSMTPNPKPTLVTMTVRPGRQFVYQGSTYFGLDTVNVDPTDPDVIEADRQQWINPTAFTFVVEPAT